MSAQFWGDVSGKPDLRACLRSLVAGGIGGAGVDDEEFIDERHGVQEIQGSLSTDLTDLLWHIGKSDNPRR